MKPGLIATYFIGSVFFMSCGGGSGADPKKNATPPPPAVEGLIVQPQHIEDDIQVSGTLLPAEQTVLMPEISGRITMLNLPEGSHVSKGTLLVKLFDGDLQAQLKKLNAQLSTAKSTEGRQKELLAVNGISQIEYEQSATQVTSIQADIDAVNAQISKTEIHAPFDGIIGLRRVSEGAFVSPGTELAVIRSEQQIKLDFSVPEAYSSTITKDIPVSFFVDGDTNRYTAHIIATERSIDAGSLNLNVRALVDKNATTLVPGASAKVSLHLGSTDKALLAPTQAIIPQARFKTVIVSRNGKAEFVKVTTGVRTPTQVEILSGLKQGDTIVTTGIQFVRAGSAVKFSSVK